MQFHFVFCLSLSLIWLVPVQNYESYPIDAVKLGKGEFQKIQEAANSESVINYVFGTDCYSRSVKSLEKGCKYMSPEEHSTLAFLLTNCFLDHSGRKTFRCNVKNIRECTSTMDEDVFGTYQRFFINIYNICIFLENDNFQKQTEHLVEKLYHSSEEIFGKMQAMRDSMELQEDRLSGLSTQVVELSKMQQLVEEGVSKGIQEVVALQQSASFLEQQMNVSLANELVLQSHQIQVLDNLAQHEMLQGERQARMDENWRMSEQFQQRMLDWQKNYQDMQDRLLASSETLMGRTDNLQDTLHKLLTYEAKTEKAIKRILGKSFTFYDLALYICGAVAGLALGNVPRTRLAGGPIVAIFTSGLIAHRFLIDSWQQFDADSSAGFLLSVWSLLFGSGYQVGWIIQLVCILLSVIILLKKWTDTTHSITAHGDQLKMISKQLQASERYVESLVLKQQKYIKKKLDPVTNQMMKASSHPSHSPNGAQFRFATNSGFFQTAFQREICRITTPMDYRYKTSTPDSPQSTKSGNSVHCQDSRQVESSISDSVASASSQPHSCTKKKDS